VSITDPTLHSILGDISKKTTEWKHMSDQFLSTWSSTLFEEGAQRSQKMGNLLSPTQLELADAIESPSAKRITILKTKCASIQTTMCSSKCEAISDFKRQSVVPCQMRKPWLLINWSKAAES